MIKSKRMMGGACSIGKMRNVCKILLGEPGGKRLLRRPECRWEQACTNPRHQVAMEPKIFMIAPRIFCVLFLWFCIFAHYIIWGIDKGPIRDPHRHSLTPLQQ
jgi:hypothetical protein